VAKVRETVEIRAPAERVWTIVHEDVKNFTKWTTNVSRVEQLTPGPPGKGTRLRYHLEIPGGIGSQVLEIEQDVYQKPKRCAGDFVRGPVSGTWSYSYREKEGVTRLTYENDYNLTGLLRFATGAFNPHYVEGIRQNLENLRRYVEARQKK
jgi:ligand-binding SRPBCC domain-containing protein